jgi:bacillithiol biosynthesis deacetylase BshB1
MGDLASLKTVLVVAPHQDDAEIGMGGTIIALLRQGVRVVIIDLSDGEPTPYGSPEIRAAETKRASELMGISERRLLGLKNREIFDTVENRKLLAEAIREIRPDILFAPYWEDAHPDHTQAAALVDAARFYSKFVKSDLKGLPWYPQKQLYFFSTHLRTRAEPSFVFDITPYLDQKIEAICAYRSQFELHPGNSKRIPVIRNEATYWGSQIGVGAGEPFLSRELLGVSSMNGLLGV